MTALGPISLCLALLYPGTQSGAAIHGHVLDTAGAVIARATVRVLDANSRATVQTAVSDANGQFAVEGLAAGLYVLAVSALGFAEKLVDIGPVRGGDEMSRTINLDVLDCDAPHVNCDIFTTGPYTDPHPVLLQRNLTVSDANAIDLEKGSPVALESPAADLRLAVQGNGLYLLPLNKAAFSRRGSDGGCGKAIGNLQSVRIDGLGPASEVIVTTRHRQCARIFFTAEVRPGANQASVYLVTRAR